MGYHFGDLEAKPSKNFSSQTKLNPMYAGNFYENCHYVHSLIIIAIIQENNSSTFSRNYKFLNTLKKRFFCTTCILMYVANTNI